jgi:hypothetical protein
MRRTIQKAITAAGRINPVNFALLVVLTGIIWTNNVNRFWQDPNRIIQHDVNIYYAYFPAVFIYHDLSFNYKYEQPAISRKVWVSKHENGRHVAKMGIGMSVMYTPFALPAHWLAKPLGFEPDGYSEIYRFAMVLSALFYTMLGLFLISKLLLRYFGKWSVTFSVVVLGLGTNLFFYTTSEPGMSHSAGFFLFSAFALSLDNWTRSPLIRNSILLGVITGLIFLVRPTNIIILVLIPLWGIHTIKDLTRKLSGLFHRFRYVGIVVLTSILVVLPQFLFWKYSSGSFYYYGYGEEGFYFSDPQFIKGLFSFRKGWLTYTPVMLFSLAGFVFLYKKHKGFFWPVLIFSLLNMYVVFSWWCWWYGGGFGQRSLIESYALLAFPLAAFIDWLFRQRFFVLVPLLGAMLFLLFLNIYQSRQYYFGSIHWDSMTREAYFDSFLRLKPSNDFQNLLDHPDYQAALEGER